MSENPENPQFLKIHKLKRFSQIPFSDFVIDLIVTAANSQHGDAFNMGTRDYYFYRRLSPNIIKERVLNSRTNKYEDQIIKKKEMTDDEINNYYKGYYYWKFIYQTRR